MRWTEKSGKRVTGSGAMDKSTCFAWGREQELGGEEIPFCAEGFLAGRAGKSLRQNYQKLPFKSRISVFKIDSGFSFPIQDFISEHYGEEGTLFEKEIKEFMELRQVGGPGRAESCFGLLRNARWRCRALLRVPSCSLQTARLSSRLGGAGSLQHALSTPASVHRLQNSTDVSVIVHGPGE